MPGRNPDTKKSYFPGLGATFWCQDLKALCKYKLNLVTWYFGKYCYPQFYQWGDRHRQVQRLSQTFKARLQRGRVHNSPPQLSALSCQHKTCPTSVSQFLSSLQQENTMRLFPGQSLPSFAEQNTKNLFPSLPAYTHAHTGMAKSWRPKPCALNLGSILWHNSLASEFPQLSQTVFIKMVSRVAQNFGAKKYSVCGHFQLYSAGFIIYILFAIS